MTGTLTGKTSVKVGDRTWVLALDFNAMCAFEEKTGKNAFGVISAFEQGAINALDLRALMWSLLVVNQPDVTLEEAGVLLTEAPEALKKAMDSAAPKRKPGEVTGKPKALARG